MIWIPVVFACTLNNDCGFIYDQPQPSMAKCIATLKNLEKKLPEDKFPIFKAGCLEVDLSGGKNSV